MNYVPPWEDAHERGFQTLPYSNIPNTTNIYVLFFLQVLREEAQSFKNL